MRRTWTLSGLPKSMADYPTSLIAELVDRLNEDREFSEAVVVLKLADGRTRSFPRKVFSDADRAYLDALPAPERSRLDDGYKLVWTNYDSVADAGKVNVSETPHFAFFWGNLKNGSGKAFFEEAGFLARIQRQFEEVWAFNAAQGVKMPYASAPDRRKIHVYIAGTGLPKHAEGFAFGGPEILMHPEALKPGSTVVAHEFTHVLQFYSGGFRDSELVGWFWECHGNWNSHQSNPGYPGALEVYADRAHYELTSSRMNYGSWPFLQLLAETPGFGPEFCHALWNQNRRDATGRSLEDPIQTAMRLGVERGRWSGDGVSGFGDVIGRLAARMAAWDFVHEYFYVRALRGYAEYARVPARNRAVLRPVADRPGFFKPLYSHAPRVFGLHLVELVAQPGAQRVVADFQGVVDEAEGSDWRVTLVAVGKDGRPRYSKTVRRGPVTLDLKPGDRGITMAVAATPTRYVPQPFRPGYNKKRRFPYEVRFVGATPAAAPPLPSAPDVPGAPHPNGGGFVAATAQVAPTAFVARGARVLDQAVVRDRARIEGFATVRDRATVSGDARVGGCALVAGSVALGENARIAEYVTLDGDGTVRGDVFLRGFGEVNTTAKTVLGGGLIGGEDLEVHLGGFPKPTIEGGKLYGFMAREQLERELEDNGYLLARWQFDEPRRQVLKDSFGDADGVLRGAPRFGKLDGRPALYLDGKTQYALLEGYLADTRTMTVTATFRGAGPILSFAGPGGFLTVRSDGVSLGVGKTPVTLKLPRPAPKDRTVTLEVRIGETELVLLLDGTPVARKASRIRPRDIGATHGFLGRGFAGCVLEVAVRRCAI